MTTSRLTSQRYYMPLLLLSLGALSVVLLFVNDSIRERILDRDAMAALQVAEVETRIATLHLWVEEFVSGDTVDLDEVAEHQQQSLALLDELAFGRGSGAAAPLAGWPEAVAILARLRPQVERFVDLSTERLEGYRAGADVGVGSEPDITYDRVFYALLADMRALDDEVLDHLASAHQRSQTLFRLMLLAWTLIIGTAVAAVWNHEKHKLAAEAALRRSEEALLQSQKMEAIGSLAGGLAHDINNYLAAISAQCEVVRMRAADTDGALSGKMDLVIQTCSRASNLLQRLLTFSRGQTVRPETTDLNRVVRELEDMARRLIGENIQLELELAPALWPVDVAISQLEQAIVNLIVNARDAMPDGGVLRIESRNLATEDSPLEPAVDTVAIAITDSGAGVPPEIRENIFEPFFTTKDKSSNSGLGLATVYGIMRQHKGVIRLLPEDGMAGDRSDGARFELCFPRSSRQAAAAASGVDEIARLGSGQRILLVEDNRDLRESTEELLAEMGFEVLSAADGEAALAVLHSVDRPFDLLMTDVVMPGLNGNELATRVVELDPAIRVLYASGYTDNVVLRAGVDEDAINFLPKPYSARELSQAIGRVLRSD